MNQRILWLLLFNLWIALSFFDEEDLMESVVYLVRSPQETISPFLYPKTKNVTIVALEKTLVAGRVVESVSGCSKEKGTTLSYNELLELLMGTSRVITL